MILLTEQEKISPRWKTNKNEKQDLKDQTVSSNLTESQDKGIYIFLNINIQMSVHSYIGNQS